MTERFSDGFRVSEPWDDLFSECRKVGRKVCILWVEPFSAVRKEERCPACGTASDLKCNRRHKWRKVKARYLSAVGHLMFDIMMR